MKFDMLKNQAEAFLSRNGATVLTAGGVIGVITTAVLTARASFKASELLQEAEASYRLESDGMGRLDTTDKVKIIWPVYVAPVVAGGITIGSVVGANMVSARKAAALAAAYALTDERFIEYKQKVAEHLTGPKQQKVLDEIAQDKVEANPPGKEVVIITEGDVLCHDLLTGRYFQSTVEKIKRAELDIKEALYNHNSASLAEFHNKIGLKPTTYTEEVGWDVDHPIEVIFSTTMADETRPCVTIDFAVLPKPNYHKNY